MSTATIRRRVIGMACMGSLGASLLLASPISAANRGVHFVVDFHFNNEVTCLNAECTVGLNTTDGTVSSNIDGQWANPPDDFSRPGLFHSDIYFDLRPGGSCNIIGETITFTFAAGAIYASSLHEDCRTTGLRIDTQFTITGGTGTFVGASGGGNEFAPAKGGFLQYNGQISY